MMAGDNDVSFVWEDYLETLGIKAVPHTLFTHVERSLASGLRPGTVVEVPDRSGEGYWPCALTLACGPLIRVRPLGLGSMTATAQFWCDPDKVRVHAPGWGSKKGLKLLPPPELIAAVGNDANVEALLKAATEEAQVAAAAVPPVTEDLLTGEGYIPVDRIKQGMKVEVQDRINPYILWVATIIENVGGRLLLRYDTPESNFPDFWLFYSSRRLFKMGFAEQNGPPWRLRWPNPESQQMRHRSSEELHAILEISKLESQRLPLPSDLVQNKATAPSHNFKLGMKLEAVDPKSMTEIRPATVVRVFDENYFVVRMDVIGLKSAGSRGLWLCTADHPYIFPKGWCRKNGITLYPPRGWQNKPGETFTWEKYLETLPDVRPAPASCFSGQCSASKLGFSQGEALEAVDPNSPDRICVATITNVTEHLLWIRLEYEPKERVRKYIVSAESMEIFPVGWCESNSYPLKPPCSVSAPLPTKRHLPSPAAKKSEGKHTTKKSGKMLGNGSSWCPKIYFNHKCFSGPFLSKGKLSGLPKSVGPGPVTLVLKEVLSMVISVAYKSSRVLKELQCDSKQPPPGHVLEVLKAKYKNNTYRANVAVVASSDDVANFCKKVCRRLQVCPYLFGPTAVGDNACPEKCNSQSKTKFTQYLVQGKRKIGRPKGETSNVVPRPKKRRGRAAAKINAAWKKLTSTSSSISVLTEKLVRPKKKPTHQLAEGRRGADISMEVDIPPSSPESKSPFEALNHHQPSLPQSAFIPDEKTDDNMEKNESKERKRKLFRYRLDSNPLQWTVMKLHRYLLSTGLSTIIANKLREEMVDGQAFMMLNLPTLEKHLKLRRERALTVCRHIERVKLAYLLHYFPKRED